MDRTPSEENADNDTSNKTSEPNPDMLENDIQNDAPNASAAAPDNDGSPPDKNDINDSELVSDSPSDVAEEQGSASEEKLPEEEVLEDGPAVDSTEEEAPGVEAPGVEASGEEPETTIEELAPDEEDLGEKPPEEILDIAEVKEEVLVEQAAEDKGSPEEVVLKADIEEVLQDAQPSEDLDQVDRLQDEGSLEKAEEKAGPSQEEAEEQPLDENEMVDSIVEYIEETVLTNGQAMDISDSAHLALLAEGIVTAIISSSIVPSITGLIKDLEDEMDVVPEGEENVEQMEKAEESGNVEETNEAEEAENEDELFPMTRKVVMLDKAVQAIAKEIDEALEALSAENVPLENVGEVGKTISSESCAISEGDAYQSCEDVSEVAEELPCGEGSGNVPCPYLEETGEETAEKGVPAVDMEDESQWEDLPDEVDEYRELIDQQGEFEPLDSSEPSAPQDTSILSESQDTPVTEDEADSQSVPVKVDTASEHVEVETPSAPVEEVTPIAAPTNAATPTAKQDTTPKPGADPDRVKRTESSGGIKSAPPPTALTDMRAVVSDMQRPAAAKPAVTPRREQEPCETCDWQQAFSNLKDQLYESPYNYICKFVVLCVAIRAIRTILLRTRCG